MIKPFISLALLLILMLSAIALHFTLYPYDKNEATMKNMAKLVQMSSLSLSVYYDESTHNGTYPEMPALDRMDFVYER